MLLSFDAAAGDDREIWWGREALAAEGDGPRPPGQHQGASLGQWWQGEKRIRSRAHQNSIQAPRISVATGHRRGYSLATTDRESVAGTPDQHSGTTALALLKKLYDIGGERSLFLPAECVAFF